MTDHGAEPRPSAPAVVLVGPPGSGKTTVGRALAERLRLEFRDTDHDIEAATGRSVSDIFVESGEAQFRALERDAVGKALIEHAGVLAVGGGAVADPTTRDQLRRTTVVFLDVGLSDAMARLEMNRSRPLLLGNIRAQWQALASARRPLYQQVATYTVKTDGRRIDEVVADVAAHVSEPS